MSERDERGKNERAQALEKIRAADREVKRIYEKALSDMTRKARAAKDGTLNQRWAREMEKSFKRRINELARDMEEEIIGAAREAAQIPCESAAGWTRDAYGAIGGRLNAENFSDMFASSAEDALRMVISGRAYLDGKTLSKRIWNQAGRLSGGISNILKDGIAQQKSTAQIAKELEEYINPDAHETIAERAARVKRAARLPFAGNIEYNCQRLARTSINHAYFLALKESAALDPFCRAIHWELSDEHFTRQVLPFGTDICDEYAVHDEGLGVGNWPIDGVPLPHAQCLCAQWAETPESLEECAERLRRWLGGGEDGELETAYGNWKDAMESGLTNKRLESIRDDAGETRKKLLEKIAGRQDVKALSVSERTRLDERLIDASEEELTRLVDMGEEYVIMIPGESNATIPAGKMDYALRINKDKARLFKSALGYVDGDQQELKNEILGKVKSGKYVCRQMEADQYGRRFKMHVILDGKGGKQADTRVGWIYKDDGTLSLTTTFPEERDKNG